MSNSCDPFVGTWELDPETLKYEQGRPGLRATYVVEPKGINELLFHLDADDADGKLIRVTYGGLLDGRDQPLAGNNVALVLTRLDDRTIESSLKRDGKIVDRWTRELLPGNQEMLITQHGYKPDGQPFRNTGIYRRVQ
jgi:hypothetical protein